MVLSMEQIVTSILKIIKSNGNLLDSEEEIVSQMFKEFSECVTKALEEIDRVEVSEKIKEGYYPERKDKRTVTFLFGEVTINRTLMCHKIKKSEYPLDKLLGLRTRQRYSPLVEVKIAEAASEATYREVARLMREWTGVGVSHSTVGKIVRQVGQAQAKADEVMIEELELSAELPEGKKVEFLMVEADGVYVKGLKKRESHEVCHTIIYEGWEKNGKRVSVVNPLVIMTSKGVSAMWSGVQAISSNRYSLEDTQIISNSDGGSGYTPDKFQTAFSQSKKEVLNQLDSFHVFKSLKTALGVKNEWEKPIREAITKADFERFKLLVDTYESTLTDDKQIEKIKIFRGYITNNWSRIFDWRDRFDKLPENARRLGVMESNQRRVSYRMKKRGMNWSKDGLEAMVKIKQGIFNGTLREAYLESQKTSGRKQKKVKQLTNRALKVFKEEKKESVGVKFGVVSLHAANSTATGKLKAILR